jgi:hypothetical protein
MIVEFEGFRFVFERIDEGELQVTVTRLMLISPKAAATRQVKS